MKIEVLNIATFGLAYSTPTSLPGSFILGKKNPGSGWSRASQKVGGDKKTAGGRSEQVAIFTAKIATDLACAQRRYPCNTSGFSYSGPQGSHLPIYANPLWFSVSFAKLRPSGPALNILL